MKNEITKEKYEANIHLNTLYDVLSALRANGIKQFYPDDINDEIDRIISRINSYIYHGHNGYDVIAEKWYSEFTFKKND
ncbi:MAG: hypothetical protein IJ568_01315 [Bacilli bacterium]|nr:hypothetical protein [Bacilli bacterium]